MILVRKALPRLVAAPELVGGGRERNTARRAAHPAYVGVARGVDVDRRAAPSSGVPAEQGRVEK